MTETTKRRARPWSEVRAEAIASGRVSEAGIAIARAERIAEERAEDLAAVRKLREMTQVQLAAAMHVSQARVSKIERGQLGSAELATLRAYVEALGGQLLVVADFGDQAFTLSGALTGQRAIAATLAEAEQPAQVP